eukprot:CAMPEP_0179216954 /NCGR_PEP_ID=MMETSP0797-20121207/3657_1 /TAXON_ID=47934 /ORGANISM="Dinophysis acuminata, Strain DAEP01" /LENGTH=125 /DNA_ID=CAMNT_0020923153 /DNA_START=829 /DNA_END=1203 /DNA_ORIENTATION=-
MQASRPADAVQALHEAPCAPERQAPEASQQGEQMLQEVPPVSVDDALDEVERLEHVGAQDAGRRRRVPRATAESVATAPQCGGRQDLGSCVRAVRRGPGHAVLGRRLTGEQKRKGERNTAESPRH